MVKGSDYRIKKLEKGPLQRFKNQNLLIKKFGEVGLQIYKAITGKRTTKELQQDLSIEDKMFEQVLDYMKEAGMVELEPVGAEKAAPKKPEKAPEKEPEEVSLEELPEEVPEEEEITPMEEEPLEPLEEIKSTEEEPPEEEPPEEEPEEKMKPLRPEKEEPEEEIKPFEFEEIKPVEEEEEEEKPEEEKPEEEEEPLEETEAEEEPLEETEEEPYASEEIEFSRGEEEEPSEEESDLSPAEKIISEKYGDIGMRVYALIDGQRTAEEIMEETGLTETKLVEILDFMDEQGIIKLDYPKGAGPRAQKGPSFAEAMEARPEEKKEMGFVPMIEGDERLEQARGVSSPVEMPIKAPLDIVKSVQMKAKTMLKFGDKGNKLLELIDGKNDVIDISLKMNLPLYETRTMLDFLMQSGMVIMKPLSRTDVRKKYGDDGYSVYKKYGKEGLMLYELIGKEMTIKQMADMVTQDKVQVIDMFIFIHKVLGIELPIDEKVLAKQLGL